MASVEQPQRLISVRNVDLRSRCNELVDRGEKYQEVGGVSGDSARAVNGLDEDGARILGCWEFRCREWEIMLVGVRTIHCISRTTFLQTILKVEGTMKQMVVLGSGVD